MKKTLLLIISLISLLGCNNKEIDIPKDDFQDNFLVLVNKQNRIKEIPTNLVYLEAPRYREIECIDVVRDAYLEFLKDTTYEFMLYSGFRSIEYQDKLYKDSGYDNTLVAKPYESEHHTGLALDISTRHNGVSGSLETTNEGKYLMNNMHKYGFILRYPKGKEDITGYQFEPWHYRYVGKEHSYNIYLNNLTLEEYLETLNV